MTEHCLERIRKRLSLPYSAACKVVTNADILGQTVEQFSSREKRYLESITDDHKRVVVYCDYCFIFGENGICITVFHVPCWFGKKSCYKGKIRIRNPKKYQKYV